MLTTAIRKRILNTRDISITDVNSLNFLLNRIEKGTEDEVIAVLNVVATQPVNKEKFYAKALKHSSPRIKEIAMRYLQSKEYQSVLPELKKMLDQNTDINILPQLIRTIATLDKNEDLTHFFEHENQDVSNAAVMAWLTLEDGERKKDAENHVSRLFESNHVKHVLKALQIVGELKVNKFADQVKILIGHQNESVLHQAIQTAGKLASDTLITQLLGIYVEVKSDKNVLEALQSAGTLAVPQIGNLLSKKENLSHSKRLKLFALLGRIGGKRAEMVLEQSLLQYPEDVNVLLSSLYLLHYSCEGENQVFGNLLSDSLGQAASVVFTLGFFNGQEDKYGLIIEALELELSALKTKCLWLFSFMYDNEKIRRAKVGFDANTKESVANAFELIQMTVPREYASSFIALFERSEPAISNPLKKLFKEPSITHQSMIRKILVEEPAKFSDWTKATILYSFKSQPKLLIAESVRPYINSENPILKEMALFINERNKLF